MNADAETASTDELLFAVDAAGIARITLNRNWAMSVPAANALSPAPVMITALIAWSASIRSHNSTSPRYIAKVHGPGARRPGAPAGADHRGGRRSLHRGRCSDRCGLRHAHRQPMRFASRLRVFCERQLPSVRAMGMPKRASRLAMRNEVVEDAAAVAARADALATLLASHAPLTLRATKEGLRRIGEARRPRHPRPPR
jgi:enoyl-CoA hydratase